MVFCESHILVEQILFALMYNLIQYMIVSVETVTKTSVQSWWNIWHEDTVTAATVMGTLVLQ